MLLPRAAHVLVVAGRVEWVLRRKSLDEACRILHVPLDIRGAGAGATPEASRRAVDPACTIDPARSVDSVRAVGAVLRRWPFGDTCLRRALVLGRLLRHDNPRLRIGVGRDRTDAGRVGESGNFEGDQDDGYGGDFSRMGSGAIVAHAWLETDRDVVGFDPDRDTPLHVLTRPVVPR